ncbi:MAG: DUF4389 domain-containing protein [Sneathiella sp.]|nr:DUF4389 domain-containing protein [Sneathiella sp.]
MDNQSSSRLKSKSTWEKFLYLLLFAICFNVAEVVLWAITIIQFVATIATGSPLRQLQVFGSSLSEYLKQVANFLTAAEDEKPFPVNAWPAPTKQDMEEPVIITPAPAADDQGEIKKVAPKKKEAPKKNADEDKDPES